MTTYSEIECDPLAKTQICFPLHLIFAAFYRTHWIHLSGQFGQEGTYKNFRAPF